MVYYRFELLESFHCLIETFYRPVGLQHEGADIFYHNCCVGNDIINGSVVLNGRCEVIGMNLEHSIGWTMSLCLKTIREEIAKMFADTKEMVHIFSMLVIAPLISKLFCCLTHPFNFQIALVGS